MRGPCCCCPSWLRQRSFIHRHCAFLAAFLLVLTLFLMREPLIIIARQQWVWRDEHEETALARRFALALGVLAMLTAAVAIPRIAWPLALACGAGAAALMAISILLAVRNRQHSVLFQTIGSVGLASSSLVAALTSGTIPGWTWLLWGASALHGASAIPLVHARLALRRREPFLGYPISISITTY